MDVTTTVTLPKLSHMETVSNASPKTPQTSPVLTFQVVLSLFMWFTRSSERGGK